MAFFPPVILIRKKVIIKRLRESGATSPETAKTLADAGIINPNVLPGVTERMVKKGIINKTADGKYYI